MEFQYEHEPVMLKEIIEFLKPKKGGIYLDCTLGGAGYTIAIAKLLGKTGKVFAIDADKLAVTNAQKIIKKEKLNNIFIFHENFKNLQKIIEEVTEKSNILDGVVFDLGLSSAQLADRTRGFSFQLDAPLDMAFGQSTLNQGQSTEYIVNNYSEQELRNIIKEYGEEPRAKRIAEAIAGERKISPITSSGRLSSIIEKVFPFRKKIHPATKTFQAFRIITNQELTNLQLALPQALEMLKTGGILAVVSFHSLEDRIVKRFFKKESKDCLCPPKQFNCDCGHKQTLKILNKKIIIANQEEAKKNPRSRSAKLRVAQKI